MKNNLAFNYYEVYNWLEINYKPYSEGPIVLKPFQPSMHFNGMCEVPPLYKETSAQDRNVPYICWDDDGDDELIRNKENKTSIRRIINFGILIDLVRIPHLSHLRHNALFFLWLWFWIYLIDFCLSNFLQSHYLLLQLT